MAFEVKLNYCTVETMHTVRVTKTLVIVFLFFVIKILFRAIVFLSFVKKKSIA